MPSSWEANFPVYQLDFAVLQAGKRVASSKRKIRWRFGFPSPEALEQGQSGIDCRGEEHDVTIVWSLTSGKRQIQMNNKEIHYSSNRAGVLDFSWTVKGHIVKVLCHASPPLSPDPGFRQYDLFVDGQSFFTMPKVYQLGIKGSKSSYSRGVVGGPQNYSIPTSPLTEASSGRTPRSNLAAPATREQEEADLQRAIRASIEESRAHLENRQQDDTRSTYTNPNENLLDFAAPAPAAQPASDTRSVASYYSAPPPSSYAPAPSNFGGSPSPAVGPGALVPAFAPSGYYHGAPPAAPPTYAAAPPPPQAPPPQQYAPAPAPPATNLMNTPTQPADVLGLNSTPGDDPFAPKTPDPTNVILGAYEYAPQTPTGAMQQTPEGVSPHANGYAANGSAPMTMNALVAQDDSTPQDEVSVALRKLVNVDRIDEPADAKILTMMQKEEKKQTTKNGKSVPIPPIASGMIGPNATLSQISSVKSDAPRYDAEGKVMNPPPPGVFHAGAAAAGALVVHGQGPPPLTTQGFGVGASLPNGGFSNQQMHQGHYYQQQQTQY